MKQSDIRILFTYVVIHGLAHLFLAIMKQCSMFRPHVQIQIPVDFVERISSELVSPLRHKATLQSQFPVRRTGRSG